MSEHAAVGFKHILEPDELIDLLAETDKIALGPARTDGEADRTSLVAIMSNWIPPLYRCVEAINERFFGFDIHGIEPPQYTVYREGDHYSWHVDMGPDTPRPRKLSLTLQLSAPEDYDGGDLEVVTGAETIAAKRDQGCVLAFPSWSLHRVTPITRGIRRSLVVWAYGPAFK